MASKCCELRIFVNDQNPLGGVLKSRGHFRSKSCDQVVFPRQPSSEITWSRNLLCRSILIRKTVSCDRGIDQWIIVLRLGLCFVYFDTDRFLCIEVKFDVFFTCEIDT